MIYKEGMYFKKTFIKSGGFIIGKLIKPCNEGKSLDKPQSWLVNVYVDHNYLDVHNGNVSIIIPTGDVTRHKVKIYKDYSNLLASVL